MTTIGTVKEVWRFPVKSMGGESISEAIVGPTGIAGDRFWAMRNDNVGEIQGAKQFPVLMRCEAHYITEPEVGSVNRAAIVLPDGTETSTDDPNINSIMSEVVGVPMSLWEIQPPDDLDHYRRRPMNEQEFMSEMQQVFQREPGEPFPDLEQFPEEILEFTSFPGMYFDVTPLHLLSTSSLDYLSKKNPEADWNVRRFRPNIVIEPEISSDSLIDNDWIGKSLRIRDLTVSCVGPTPRCGMTSREQGNLHFDKTILRTIVKEADQNVGVYAVVTQPGGIRVGDAVEII